jgi:D-galactarolactone isomerase
MSERVVLSSAPSKTPADACDCHMHVYAGSGPAPAPFPAPPGGIAEYLTVMRRLGLSRVVDVQSMLYANDNTIMLSAMGVLGDCSRDVIVDPRVTDEDLAALNRKGVRAFMVPGRTYAWTELPGLADRVAPFGWRLQVHMDGRDLEDMAPLLGRLPTPVIIDHVGKFLEPTPVGHPAVAALRRLVGGGRCWVKLSGMYETSKTGAPAYADVSALASGLISDAPERMVWSGNWPHPNLQPPADDYALLPHFTALAPDPSLQHRILVDNPAELYRFARKGEADGL